jgi:competence protein ComEA
MAPAAGKPTVVPPPESAAEAAEPAPGEALDLNTANYEDLRDLGLSVTQTGRVLAYRERVGGFKSVDDLDAIPGFPRAFLGDFKKQLRV